MLGSQRFENSFYISTLIEGAANTGTISLGDRLVPRLITSLNGSFKGTIFDGRNNQKLKGISVFVYAAGSASYNDAIKASVTTETTTDDVGLFQTADIAEGSYYLVFSKTGYYKMHTQ